MSGDHIQVSSNRIIDEPTYLLSDLEIRADVHAIMKGEDEIVREAALSIYIIIVFIMIIAFFTDQGNFLSNSVPETRNEAADLTK